MTKSKQWLCKLIVFFILLVGMCDKEINADSIFLYPQILMNDQNASEVLSEAEIEPTELLCIRNTVTGNQIIMHLTNSKRTIKLSMIFLCITVYCLLLSNFYKVERIEEFPRLSMQNTVLAYIHNIDGKK